MAMSRRAWAEAARKLLLTTLSSSSSSSLASRVIVRTSKTGSPLLSIPTGSASPADTPHNHTQYHTSRRNVCAETVTRCSRASIQSKQQMSMYMFGDKQDQNLPHVQEWVCLRHTMWHFVHCMLALWSQYACKRAACTYAGNWDEQPKPVMGEKAACTPCQAPLDVPQKVDQKGAICSFSTGVSCSCP